MVLRWAHANKFSCPVHLPSTEKARSTFPGAAPKKAYPELTNSVPPTMTAPGPSSAPPCAFTPFAVLKSLAEYARKCPSSPPEKTTPGMAGHRGRLCWTASGAVSTARMRCLPGNLAGVQLQREKAAANLRIQLRREAQGRIARSRRSRRHGVHGYVRQGHVHDLFVRCGSPLHPASRSAAADAPLPQHRTLRVRVQSVDHSGFLAGNQRTAPLTQFHQNC